MNRKEIETETRKNYIIDTAEKLFLKKGYLLTTMDEIAERSEFSKPTVYKYFKSKEDIGSHVHLKFLPGRIEYTLNAMKAYEKPYDKLFAFGMAYYDYAYRHIDEFKFQITCDSFSTDLGKVSEEVLNNILTLNDKIGVVIKEAFGELMKNEKPFDEFDLQNTMVSFYISLRTVMSVSFFDRYRYIEDTGRSFYINFLKIFLRGLEK